MKIVDRKIVDQNMSGTKTVQNFGTFLGKSPHKLGTVVTMYPHLAIATLTDSLKNIYYNQKQKANSFTPINSMAIQWDIDVNFIKKVNITGAITGDGANKRVETIILEEHYYDKNDTFTLENKQQLFVVDIPKKLGERRWAHRVKLVGDGTRTIATSFAAVGRTTRYRSNYHAELSERGYTKYVTNSETHRNYLSRHRAGDSWSSDFAVMEDTYIQVNKPKKEGGGYEYYKMNKKEKNCLDTFLLARENHCIFGQTNFDVAGKCMDQDEDGRDIPMGDGIVPQIERYCDKFAYSVLTSDIIDDAISAMVQKSDSPTGNRYAIVSNERQYSQYQRLMKNDLRFVSPADGSYFFSKEKGEIKVGATFSTYEIAGNWFNMMPDRALSQEYPDYGYGLFLDTGRDMVSGRPNVAAFTLEGSEMLSGTLNGMGGYDGKTSGEIATPVAGSSYHLLGYSATVLFNPYKSFILLESVVF